MVAEGAIKALRENDTDIKNAVDLGVAANLAADKLLMFRNFVSEGLRAMARKSGPVWEFVKPELELGTRAAVRALPLLGIMALLDAIGVPVEAGPVAPRKPVQAGEKRAF